MKEDTNTDIYQCQHCGKEYTPRRRFAQKYCSSSCNVAACRKRNGYIYNPRYVPPDKPSISSEIPLIVQSAASSHPTAMNIVESAAGSLIAQVVTKGVEYFVDTKEVTLLRKLQKQVIDLQTSTDPTLLVNQIYSGLNELMIMMMENTKKIVHSQDKLNNKVDLIIKSEDEVIWQKQVTNEKGSNILTKIYNPLTQQYRIEDQQGRLFTFDKAKNKYRPVKKLHPQKP